MTGGPSVPELPDEFAAHEPAAYEPTPQADIPATTGDGFSDPVEPQDVTLPLRPVGKVVLRASQAGGGEPLAPPTASDEPPNLDGADARPPKDDPRWRGYTNSAAGREMDDSLDKQPRTSASGGNNNQDPPVPPPGADSPAGDESEEPAGDGRPRDDRMGNINSPPPRVASYEVLNTDESRESASYVPREIPYTRPGTPHANINPPAHGSDPESPAAPAEADLPPLPDVPTRIEASGAYVAAVADGGVVEGRCGSVLIGARFVTVADMRRPQVAPAYQGQGIENGLVRAFAGQVMDNQEATDLIHTTDRPDGLDMIEDSLGGRAPIKLYEGRTGRQITSWSAAKTRLSLNTRADLRWEPQDRNTVRVEVDLTHPDVLISLGRLRPMPEDPPEP